MSVPQIAIAVALAQAGKHVHPQIELAVAFMLALVRAGQAVSPKLQLRLQLRLPGPA